MAYGLTSVLADVADYAVAAGEAFLPGDNRDHLEDVRNYRAVFGSDLVNPGDVGLGDNQNVRGSHRRDVAECKHLVVLENLC